MLLFEQEAFAEGFKIVAGVDEAGRGPLAGPVVASACILGKNFCIKGIDDSKKLSHQQRLKIYEQLVVDKNIVFAVGVVEPSVIDEINIYQATIVAMNQAICSLSIQPDIALVDGLKLPHPTIVTRKIIRGDQLSLSIATASIIAKVIRDKIMVELDKVYPGYGFAEHKGYPTKKHKIAIQTLGPTPVHRLTFNGCQIDLENVGIKNG